MAGVSVLLTGWQYHVVRRDHAATGADHDVVIDSHSATAGNKTKAPDTDVVSHSQPVDAFDNDGPLHEEVAADLGTLQPQVPGLDTALPGSAPKIPDNPGCPLEPSVRKHVPANS